MRDWLGITKDSKVLSRTQKAKLNISSALIYQLFSIICGLIIPRLILLSFGSTYNGVINSATQLLEVVGLLDIGIAGATRLALFKPLATGDTLSISRIMKATKIFYRKIAGIIIGFTVILMFIYPYISHNDLRPWECAILIAIVGISSFSNFYFTAANSALLAADQTSFWGYGINSIFLIINTIASVFLIKKGYSIFVVQFSIAIIYFVKPIIVNKIVKLKYNLSKNCETDNTGMKNRGVVAFHSVANFIHNQTDIIILTLFSSAQIISVYTTYYLVAGKIKSLFIILTAGFEGAFGNMWVNKEIDTMNCVFLDFEFILYSFITILFSCMGILIIPFISLYTAGVSDTNYILPSFAVLVTITEGAFCIRQPYLILIQGAGFYKETKNGAMAEAFVNLTLSIILVKIIGLNGVIIGTLVANVMRTTQYIFISSKYILIRPLKIIIKRISILIVNLILIIILAKVIYRYSDYFVNRNWYNFVYFSVKVFIASNVITFISAFIFDRSSIRSIFRRLIAKKIHI